uniref:Apple domain-containing protein n=1 Tax=Chenopodium quinoa TaxID=63459 RepID=A0A803NC28_CHEQI
MQKISDCLVIQCHSSYSWFRSSSTSRFREHFYPRISEQHESWQWDDHMAEFSVSCRLSLTNMKFILNNNPEFRKVVQAWKSPSDPSVGRYYNTGYGNILINTGSFAQEEVRGMLSLVFTGANETLLPRYVIIDQGILAESGGMIARRTGELRGMPRKIYVTPMCRTTCLANCSCLAYTHDTGTGCMRWSENLIDIEDLSPGGVDLFIRLEQSELSTSKRYDFRNSSDCHYHILPVQMESSEKG